MNDLVQQDYAARAAALDPARSILLQAPAGSGKTTVLTQRFLRLLSCVDEPEEILAITFTRKAAAEMRQRVLDVLDGILPEKAALRQTMLQLRVAALRQAELRGWDPQELPARLRIQTIDSLNHELARSMPILGRAAGALEVIDRAVPLYLRAARQTLLDAEEDPEFQPDMDLLFRRLDNRWTSLQELLGEMLARRAQWLPPLLSGSERELADWVEESLAGIVIDVLGQATQCLGESLLAEGAALARAAASHRVELRHEPGSWQLWLGPGMVPGSEPEQLSAWVGLAQLAQTQAGGWRRSITKSQGFPADDKLLKQRFAAWIEALQERTGAQECLVMLQLLPPALLGDEDKAALAALTRLLKLAASELKLQFQAAGRVDHSEVAAVARQALTSLGTPSDFAIRHTTALRHLLVDEFQDTSIEQFSLLEALTVGWQTGDGRSLFLVGDPMQSIYLFRSAEVGLFLRARQQGIGAVQLESLQLSRNFRSAPTIVEWVNRGFAQIFPGQNDLRSSAVSYHASAAARDDLRDPLYGVSLRQLPDDDRAVEALQIAALVAGVRERSPDASIAVLILARSHAPAIMRALAQLDIPTRGIDLAPLAEQPSVSDVVALTRALLHAGDRSAWLAVLRAPFCGLSLDDLYLLFAAEHGPQRTAPEILRDVALAGTLSEDGQARLQRWAAPLLAAFDNRGRADLASEVETLWLQLGGPAACASPRDVGYAREFLDALRELDSAGVAVDAGLVESLAKDLKTGGEGDAGTAVDILTIHKAKGLEWDVVIVPGLNRAARQADKPLLRWLELPRRGGGNDLLMAALRIGDPEGGDPVSSYIGHLQRQRAANERMRLAYVAATRARRQLVLFAHAEWVPDRNAPRLRAGSLLQTLWPAVAAEFTAALATPLEAAIAAVPATAAATANTPAQILLRLPSDWRPPPAPAPIEWDSIDVGAEEAAPQPEYSWVGQGARAVGTIVHAELERLTQQQPAAAALRERLPVYRSWLRQLGVAGAEAGAAADRILSVLERALADPRAQWLLASTHRAASSELRLTGLVAGRLRNVIIDRSFVDETGSRWVVDYKTSGHEGGDLEQFLQQELERYRPQLTQYRALAAQLGPEPVRTALYFPLLGEFRELPPS